MKPVLLIAIAWLILACQLWGQVPEPSPEEPIIPGVGGEGDLDKLIAAISKGATAQVMATDRIGMKFEEAIKEQTGEINSQFDKQGVKLDEISKKMDRGFDELRKLIVESKVATVAPSPSVPEPSGPDPHDHEHDPLPAPKVSTPIVVSPVHTGSAIVLNPGERLIAIDGVPVSSSYAYSYKVQSSTVQRATTQTVSPAIGSKASTRWSRLPDGSNGNAIRNLDPHLNSAHQISWDNLADMSAWNKYYVHDYDHDRGWQPGRGTPPSSVFFQTSSMAATVPPPSGGGSGGSGGGCPDGNCPIFNRPVFNRPSGILSRIRNR